MLISVNRYILQRKDLHNKPYTKKMFCGLPNFQWQQIVYYLNPGTLYLLYSTCKYFSNAFKELCKSTTIYHIVESINKLGSVSATKWIIRRNLIWKPLTYIVLFDHVHLSYIKELDIFPLRNLSSLFSPENVQCGPECFHYTYRIFDLLVDSTACVSSVHNRNQACLPYAHENGYPWGVTICAPSAAYLRN